MPEFPIDHDHASIERRLRQLRPAAVTVERDALLYQAGWEAAAARFSERPGRIRQPGVAWGAIAASVAWLAAGLAWWTIVPREAGFRDATTATAAKAPSPASTPATGSTREPAPRQPDLPAPLGDPGRADALASSSPANAGQWALQLLVPQNIAEGSLVWVRNRALAGDLDDAWQALRPAQLADAADVRDHRLGEPSAADLLRDELLPPRRRPAGQRSRLLPWL